MENFTDLFGDDLSSLEGLGDFGNFAGNQGDDPNQANSNSASGPNSTPGSMPSSGGMDQTGGMINTSGAQQQQQQQQQQQFPNPQGYPPGTQAQKMPGYDYNQYRPMAPGGGSYGSYGNGPPGYPNSGAPNDPRMSAPMNNPRMAGYSSAPGMMGSSSMMQDSYPGYQGSGGQHGQMYGNRQMGQSMPSGNWNQSPYPQGAQMRGHYPNASQMGQNYRHPGYPSDSSQRMSYPNQQSSNIPSQGYPGQIPRPSSSVHQQYPNPMSQPYQQVNSQRNNPSSQQGSIPPTSSSNDPNSSYPNQYGLSGPNQRGASPQQKHSFAPNMPNFPRNPLPPNHQASPLMPHGRGSNTSQTGRHAAPLGSSQSHQPPPQSQNMAKGPPPGAAPGPPGNLTPLPPQPPVHAQQPPGQIYRSPYPPHPSSQQPGNQSARSPATMSPKPMSPATSSSSSPAPSNSSVGGSATPSRQGDSQSSQNTTSQPQSSNSSLQQLEQMVMPGSNNTNPAGVPHQATSPMPSRSPAVRGQNMPLSPQQWSQQQQKSQQMGTKGPQQQGQDNSAAQVPPHQQMGMMQQGLPPGAIPMGPRGPHHPGMMMDQQRMHGPNAQMHPGMYGYSSSHQGVRVPGSGTPMMPHPGMRQGHPGMNHMQQQMNQQMLSQQSYPGMHQNQQQSYPRHGAPVTAQSGMPMTSQPSSMPQGMPMPEQTLQKNSFPSQQQQQQQTPLKQKMQHPVPTAAQPSSDRMIPTAATNNSQAPTNVNTQLLNTYPPSSESQKPAETSTTTVNEISDGGTNTKLEEKQESETKSLVPTKDQQDLDREASVVTPKLDEGEYKADFKDEVESKPESNEPSSSEIIKPEEPSSTTSPQNSVTDNKPDSSEDHAAKECVISSSDTVATDDNERSVLTEQQKEENDNKEIVDKLKVEEKSEAASSPHKQADLSMSTNPPVSSTNVPTIATTSLSLTQPTTAPSTQSSSSTVQASVTTTNATPTSVPSTTPSSAQSSTPSNIASNAPYGGEQNGQRMPLQQHHMYGPQGMHMHQGMPHGQMAHGPYGPMSMGPPGGQMHGPMRPDNQRMPMGPPHPQRPTMTGPEGQMMGPRGPDGQMIGPRGPDGQMMGPRGPDGQMMGPRGPDGQMMGPRGPDGQMMGPRGPDGQMMGPRGPDGQMMGPRGPDGQMMGPRGSDGQMMGPRGPDGQPVGHSHQMMQPGMSPHAPHMMGQNGPMHPAQMRMPMAPGGPRMMPPHPMQMEMQHLHQQLNHLYSQPQNPQIIQQINEIRGRIQHLQQQMSQMPPGQQWGPPHPHAMGPRPPNAMDSSMPPQSMGSHDTMPNDNMAVSDNKFDIYDFDNENELRKTEHQEDLEEETGKKKKKSKAGKEPKPPKEKKARKNKETKSKKSKKDESASTSPPSSSLTNDGSVSDPINKESSGVGEESSGAVIEKPKKSKSKAKKKKKDADLEAENFPENDVQNEESGGVETGEEASAQAGEDDDDIPIAEKKEKKPKVKVNTPKKPKPNKTLLQFTRKKRKRDDSGSDFDLDVTPPPSPKDDENVEKRRSGRITNNRKKYVDDVDLNLSDDEHLMANLPADVAAEVNADSKDGKDSQPKADSSNGTNAEKISEASSAVQDQNQPSGPNYAFIDPLAEDTMIVQFILAMRKGTRELESDDEDEPVVKSEEAKKEENKTKEVTNPEETKKDDTKTEQEEKTEESSEDKAKVEMVGEVKEEEDKVEEVKKEETLVEKSEEKMEVDDKIVAQPEHEPKEEKMDVDGPNKPAEEAKDTKDEVQNSSNENKVEKDADKEPEKKPEVKVLEKDKKPARVIEVEEFLVKFKNFSYLHCQWSTEEELHRGDKRISSKIKRFKQKRDKSANLLEFCEEEPFNPDYVEVDRVLDESEHTDEISKTTTKHYLVKWRSLPYEDCTWELESDVDPKKIEDFLRWRQPPPGEYHHKRRGRKHEWKKYDESLKYKNGNTLRPYQLEGVNWLLFSWHNGRNCLLADEMGLGKTIQSLAFLQGVYNYGIPGPFLVIAPLSTIPNWQREFELWSDMNVIVYHGSQTSRNMLAEYEIYYKDDKGERRNDVFKFHVLITTYECVITDILELREIKWRVCVIDEAHRLKNQKCKLLEGLNLLDIESRLLLSGTPLQNNIHELYSLLSFLEPTQFNSQEAFMKDFGDMQNEDQVTKLQALLKPLMLRRMKEDVEKSLKPKEETIVEVELTNIQKKYYRGILEKNFSFLQKGTTTANVPNLMNTMMELRKCCIHPYLLNGAEEQIQDDYRSRKNDFKDEEGLYFQSLINSSGKMVLLDKLLPKLKGSGHRVLIFSQMVKMLDILEDYLIRKQYPFERIDGRIRGNVRQAAIDRYCRPDSDRFVFLLCTKAGGLGINLVAADTCIIYDSDWNPQNDLQAQARCHRIGQDKMVKIYRLITRNTYEREMFDRASLKLGLDKAVLQSMNTNQGSKTAEKANALTKTEIENLLKKGAYGALMEDDNAGDKFCEEDIEHILLRRTQTVTVETEKSGGSFSKASFASADTVSDINIDDPDFWAKWAKKAEVEEVDESTSLMMSEPRARKKIQRFGGNENLDPRDVSDLDSSSDSDDDLRRGRSKNKKLRSRRGRRSDDEDYMEDERDVEYGGWSKREIYRIETNLLAFGWGRWEEILDNSSLRKGYSAKLIEDVCRLIVLYCINTYKGDEKIKSFVWDLITPEEYGGGEKVGKNHSGLSGPVPRGRKGKKIKNNSKDGPPGENIAWVSDDKFDMEMHLDKNYRKHLDRHGTKLLLRIRMLYYLQQDILAPHMKQINTRGVTYNDVKFTPPVTDGLPCSWWDVNADKSLLIGTVRHGFERYNTMRLDPDLIFLSRCGPPDSQDVQEELKKSQTIDPDENSKLDDDDDSMGSKTPNESRASSVKPEDNEGGKDAKESKDSKEGKDTKDSKDAHSSSNSPGFKQFPSITELNGRLRRLITSYQREFKKEEARLAAREKRNERRERIEQVIREREQQKIDLQQKKWSKKEETDFAKTLFAYGIDYNKKEKKYVWDRFRQLAKLEKKFDDTLSEYYLTYIAMCKKVVGKKLTESEELLHVNVEAISAEKAKTLLDRIDFIRKLREEVIFHPNLEERIELCDTANGLPKWWIPVVHDRDLFLGASRHGLSRMEYYVLNDPELCFKDILKRHLCGEPLLDEKAMKAFLKRKGRDKEPKVEEKPEKSVKISDEVQINNDDKKDSDKKDSEKKEESAPPGKKRKAASLKKPEEETFSETRSRRKSTRDATEATKLAIEASKMAKAEAAKPKEKEKKNESKDYEKESKKDKEKSKENKEKEEKEKEDKSHSKETTKDSSEVKEEKEQPENKEKKENLRKKISVSIEAPQISAQQMEMMTKGGMIYDVEAMNELMAQTYAAAIEWPKDKILETRLRHIVECIEKGFWPVAHDYALGDHLTEEDIKSVTPEPFGGTRDSSTPMSESSEVSAEDPNILTHGGLSSRRRGRKPLDYQEDKSSSSKIRSILQQPVLENADDPKMSQEKEMWENYIKSLYNDKRTNPSKNGSKNEVANVNGDSESGEPLAKKKASKLESALDKLGFHKKKLSDETSDDKSKKKKRLDDIMFGLGAAKGVQLESKKESLKKDEEQMAKMPDLSKLQEMLGGSSDTKVQKWLADQMGVVPDRPLTPSSSTATSSPQGKSKLNTTNPMDWMSYLSGDEYVTVFNRFTGKKLSGSQGPKLKCLAQWLIENPMFEVDPKWAEMMKSKQPASNDLKRKGPGRPPLDEPAAKMSKPSSGVGPSYSTSGINTMASLGLDPKNPLSSLTSLDPKNPMSSLTSLDPKNQMSLAALYGLDPKKLDPMTAALLGMGDPKNPGKIDPMMLAAMGMDSKSLQAMGIDPKLLGSTDMSSLGLAGLDPKSLQALAGMDSKSLQAMGLDPKLLQSMGLDAKSLQSLGMDSKTLQSLGLDPKAFQSLGTDTKSLQSMGLDSKTLQSLGMDPKMLQAMGMDAKSLQALGIDPKLMQSMGMDPKTLSAMGLDPKALQMLGMDPKMLMGGLDPKVMQSMGMDDKTLRAMGIDPKTLKSVDSKSASQTPALDPKMLQAMGMDPKSLQSLGLDAKTLQSLGIDSKMLQAMGMAESKKSVPSSSSNSTKSGEKAKTDKATTDLLAQVMGMDPKKMDPALLSSLGLNANNLKLDSATLKALGLDPKNPNSNMIAAMAAMDPTSQLAALYGYGMPGMPMIPGMDMLGMSGKGKSSPGLPTKDSRSASSPRGSRASPSPRPPSRASSKSDERRSPRSSAPPTSATSPKVSTSSSFGSFTASQLGFDPKLLAGMDPKLLQAAGIDPKTMGLDPRLLGLDSKAMQNFGIDPKMMPGLDSKLASELAGMDLKLMAGLDPKLLAGMDPKLLAGMDPKLLTGMDPKLLAGMDPKMLGMLDPKMMSMMDPKAILGGMDPKLFGFDPKMFSSSNTKSSSSASLSQATSLSSMMTSTSSDLDPRLLGLDLKMLQGLDSNALQSLGLDPKLVASLLEQPSKTKDSTSKTAAKMTSSTTPTFTSLEAKPSPSTSKSSTPKMDPKVLSGLDPKLLGFDPKLAASYGLDPKLLAGMDPKLLAGMDPKNLGLDMKSLAGLDPKLLGFDPKLYGLDPKSLSKMDSKMLAGLDLKQFGLDPKLLSTGTSSEASQKLSASMDLKALAGLDPKALAGLDPKMFGGLDPKMLAGLDPKYLSMVMDPKLMAGMDPKLLSGIDPSIAAMYSMGLPTSLSTSLSNGIPSPKTSKPKPGTVAAALAEKKGEKAQSDDTETKSEESKDQAASAAVANNSLDASIDKESLDSHKGLTSEERVLLREKKRERLQKREDDQGSSAAEKSLGSSNDTKEETEDSKPEQEEETSANDLAETDNDDVAEKK